MSNLTPLIPPSIIASLQSRYPERSAAKPKDLRLVLALLTRFNGIRTIAVILFLAMAAIPALPQSASSPSGTASSGAGLYQIAGTVVNALTDEPVGRATVAVLSIADSRMLQSVVCGDDGHFALEGLAAAKYQLTASKRGYRTTFYDQHEEYNSAIVTGDGQETEKLIFRLTPTALLRGTVTADGGDPVESAQAMLFLKPRGHNPGDRIVQVAIAVTDDAGAYEFDDLAAGDYLLAVRAEPWYALRRSGDAAAQSSPGDPASALDVAYPVTYFDSTTDEASALPIPVAAGSRTEANTVLHAVPTLRLTVQSSKQGDSREQTEVRQIVFGSTVSAQRTGFPDDSEPIRTGQFNGLAPGHYELQQGDPPRLVDLEAVASQQIDLSAGIPAVSVSGTLRSAHDPGSGSINLCEINLALNPLDGSSGRQQLRATAIEGKFIFATVLPGNWLLTAASSGKELQIFSITADGKTHSGNQLTVQDRNLSLTVTVSDGATRIEGFARKNGKGMAGAMIVLVPLNPGANVGLFRRDQSDSDGSFALLDVVPGQYKIVAIEDGWELDWARPEVIARYLPQGIAVSIDGNSGKLIRLSGPVPVQPR